MTFQNTVHMVGKWEALATQKSPGSIAKRAVIAQYKAGCKLSQPEARATRNIRFHIKYVSWAESKP